MHSRSRSVKRMPSPMKKLLLRMLWWVSVAPFGTPVVPEVNWMLIASSNWSASPMRASEAIASALAGAVRSSKLSIPAVFAGPRRTTNSSSGSAAARSLPGGEVVDAAVEMRADRLANEG